MTREKLTENPAVAHDRNCRMAIKKVAKRYPKLTIHISGRETLPSGTVIENASMSGTARGIIRCLYPESGEKKTIEIHSLRVEASDESIIRPDTFHILEEEFAHLE